MGQKTIKKFANIIGLIALSAPSSAFAQAEAGVTAVQNTARSTYRSGAKSSEAQSNLVSIPLDELIDVTVTSPDPSPVRAGSGMAVLRYLVKNTGKGREAFKLKADASITGNAFAPVVEAIVADTNNNSIYDSAIDKVLALGTSTPIMLPGETINMFVLASLPVDAKDREVSQIMLIAEAATGVGKPGTVFAKSGEFGNDAIVGLSGAKSDAMASMRSALAFVALTKTSTIQETLANNHAVSGSTITYKITAVVTGSGEAEELHITDEIPAGTIYSSGTLRVDGANLSDAADRDSGAASAAGIDVNLGMVAGGTTRTVSFTVKVK